MNLNIKIATFTSGGIKTYIPSIAKGRAELLRDKSQEEESRHLKKLILSKETLAVVVFDSAKVVGSALASPLELEPGEIQAPFLAKNRNPALYLYLSPIALQEAYYGKGLLHHFFDLREEHARHLKKYRYLTFCAPEKSKKTKDEAAEETFWKKQGYTAHPELSLVEEKKKLIFWLKSLN